MAGLLQHRIASLVAERVIDQFEVIQINEQNGESGTCLPGPVDGCVQQFTESRAVWQPGQTIVRRQNTEFFPRPAYAP